jgi:hypothetical protein
VVATITPHIHDNRQPEGCDAKNDARATFKALNSGAKVVAQFVQVRRRFSVNHFPSRQVHYPNFLTRWIGEALCSQDNSHGHVNEHEYFGRNQAWHQRTHDGEITFYSVGAA